MNNSKIILIKKATRMEDLIYRFNTKEQVKFYLKSLGSDINEYQEEHDIYYQSLHEAEEILKDFGRVFVLDRKHLAHFLFGKDDIIVALGSNGLAVNTLKYLNNQPLVGVKADNNRNDEILMPFSTNDLHLIMPEVIEKKRPIKDITMAKVQLSDKQTLYAVNDFFIGQKTHVSARYTLNFNGQQENQSSSGIIVSTGFGSTGWLKSVLTGAAGISSAVLQKDISFQKTVSWDSDELYFSVREPFPSARSGTSMIFGKIDKKLPLRVVSNMPENGVIFSDGIEEDFLAFQAGFEATIGIAEKKGKIVY